MCQVHCLSEQISNAFLAQLKAVLLAITTYGMIVVGIGIVDKS